VGQHLEEEKVRHHPQESIHLRTTRPKQILAILGKKADSTARAAATILWMLGQVSDRSGHLL
jgi:hypothetical protein